MTKLHFVPKPVVCHGHFGARHVKNTAGEKLKSSWVTRLKIGKNFLVLCPKVKVK